MMLRLVATLLALASAARAFSPTLTNFDSSAQVSSPCRSPAGAGSTKRSSMELFYSTVDGYHSSLSENKKLFSKLKSQVENLKSDITNLKAASSEQPRNYCFAGKKDYNVRAWYEAGGSAFSETPANGDTPPNGDTPLNGYSPANGYSAPANGVTQPNGAAPSNGVTQPNGYSPVNGAAPANGVTQPNGYSPVNGATPSSVPSTSASGTSDAASGDRTGLNALESGLLEELLAVSAELEKVAAENEALKKMQAMHEQRERELQDQVAFQLAIYNCAEKELEQVKAQSLKQLEITNQRAAERLAAETSEFKARLLEAERMVFKMKRILEKAEGKLDIKLLDDSMRDYTVQTTTVDGLTDEPKSKMGKRWGKVKSTWGKVKSVFKSKEDANGASKEDVNGASVAIQSVFKSKEDVNGASVASESAPCKKYEYSLPLPEEPPFQVELPYHVSRVENLEKLAP